jgi:hypothetical protein
VQDLNLTADARVGSEEGEESTAQQQFLQDDDDDDDEPQQEYNGELPDFSDNEQEDDRLSSPAIGSTRLPMKPKGPPGRKRAPLSLLKKKKPVTPASPATLSTKSAFTSTDKRVQQVSSAPGGVKLTDTQLDAAIAQLVDEHPDMAGKFTRQQVQEMIHQAGISKKFLQGKEGLGGKNQKDMASVTSWILGGVRIRSCTDWLSTQIPQILVDPACGQAGNPSVLRHGYWLLSPCS